MDNSPFNNLAAELRIIIWELALTHDSVVVVSTETSNAPRLTSPAPSSNILALTRTCNQIRHQALCLVYDSNSFRFETDPVSLDSLRLENFGSHSTGRRFFPEKKADKMMWLQRNGDVPLLWKWLRQISPVNARNIHALEISLEGWVPGPMDEQKRAAIVPKMLGAVVQLYRGIQPTGNVTIILDAAKFDEDAKIGLDTYKVDVLDHRQAGITIYDKSINHLRVAGRKYIGGEISVSKYRQYYDTIYDHRARLIWLINMTYLHARTESI